MRTTFFATCARGLEPALHAELSTLRLGRVERQVGGVRFEGALADAWRANLWTRTANRVLMRLARFPARTGDELYQGAAAVDWGRFLGPEGTLHVMAQSNESALDHTLFVEQRVKDAVVDGFRERAGARPSVDAADPDLRIHVHLFRDRCTLSADTTGIPLYRRGWRRAQGRAPLAETLAAGLVHLSGWDGRSPLVDPFCGSGTILVEAALRAAGRAPGAFRDAFGFERWPGHDAARWRRVRDEARAAGELPRKVILVGSDADPKRVAEAEENAEAAGLGGRLRLEVADARAFAPRRGWNAWVVSNLPYGHRVGAEAEVRETHRAFGARLREHAAGFHVTLMTGGPELTRELGLPGGRRTPLRNGALDCEVLSVAL